MIYDRAPGPVDSSRDAQRNGTASVRRTGACLARGARRCPPGDTLTSQLLSRQDNKFSSSDCMPGLILASNDTLESTIQSSMQPPYRFRCCRNYIVNFSMQELEVTAKGIVFNCIFMAHNR